MPGSNTPLRSFLPSLYPVAALLAVSPFTELFGVGQARPDLAAWRFGVVGLGFNALVVHTLGLAMGLAVAAYLGHRRVLRMVSAASLIAAMLVVAGIARFLLDFRQIQMLVSAAERPAFDAATLRALILASLAAPVLVVLGGRGWAASAVEARNAGTERDPAPPPSVIPFPGRSRAPDARWRR